MDKTANHMLYSEFGEKLRMGRPIDILLVEDNMGDIRLTQEAFREGKLCNNLYTVQDGVEAMAFLRKADQYAESPTPDLVLLDLNLPKKDGREVLAEIKSDEKLRNIPVVVLTTSNAEKDIAASYGLYANCFITKPVDLDKFINVVNRIQDFWLTVVTLPSRIDNYSENVQ
jgi:CheY-like chemotaxis protein